MGKDSRKESSERREAQPREGGGETEILKSGAGASPIEQGVFATFSPHELTGRSRLRSRSKGIGSVDRLPEPWNRPNARGWKEHRSRARVELKEWSPLRGSHERGELYDLKEKEYCAYEREESAVARVKVKEALGANEGSALRE